MMASPKNENNRDVVEEEEVRAKAYRWCKDSIGGAWSRITSNEMVLQHVRQGNTPQIQGFEEFSPDFRRTRKKDESGGMSNYLYLCQLPGGVSPQRGEPSQVLLRIYGHITTSSMDVLVHNSVVFAILAEKRLGPKPYGMFYDGRIEEFIVARPLRHKDLSRPDIVQLVAARLACFHSLDMPLCKKPRWMFSVIKRWLSEIQDNFSVHSNNNSRKTASDAILRLQAIDMEKEFNVLIETLRKVDSPVVFCHNDLQEGNILFNEKEVDPEKRMTIIDWEYGNYNYRGFDLGNHFCEWAISYDEETYTVEPDRYPSRQKQYDFFRHYLKGCGQDAVSEEDLRRMYVEVNTFALASHFLWATWSAIQGHSSSIDFAYYDYAVSRFEEYFKLKERLPKMLVEDL